MTIDDFDPNAKGEPRVPVWATFIPSRTPNFKTHTQRSHAINALNNSAQYARSGIIYEFVDGEWVEWDRFEEPTNCAHCKKELERTWADRRLVHRYPVQYSYKRPFICGGCYENHFGYAATEPKDIMEIGNER